MRAGGGRTFQIAIQLQRHRKPILLEWALQMKSQILVATIKMEVKVCACEGGAARTNTSVTKRYQDTTKKSNTVRREDASVSDKHLRPCLLQLFCRVLPISGRKL